MANEAAGTPAGTAARRGRGERAGLDRATIVAAARSLDPATLTMQDVADALGVDRKALHHHVTGRDALLELLATDAALTGFSATRIAPDADWREACRLFADGLRSSLVASGSLALRFRTSTDAFVGAARPGEAVVERMLAAGFDEVTAGRGLLLLTTISVGFARDEVMSSLAGGHPQVSQFRAAMAGEHPTGMEVLRRLDESGFDPYGAEQFAFDVETFLTAMAARLPSG